MHSSHTQHSPPCVTIPRSLPAGVTCEVLTEPTNGLVRYPNDGNMFGDTADYECDTGYDLTGTPVRTCQANRAWSLTAPTCTRKYMYAPTSSEVSKFPITCISSMHQG